MKLNCIKRLYDKFEIGKKEFYVINAVYLFLVAIFFQNPSILVIGEMSIFLIDIIVIRKNSELYKLSLIILLIAYTYLIIMYFWYYSYYGAPYYFGNSDDYNFEISAQQVLNEDLWFPWEIKASPAFNNNNSIGFIWTISILMRLGNLMGGYHTVVFRLLNIHTLLCMSIMVYKYFKRHYSASQKLCYLLLLTLCLFPNCLYISSHVFRDTISAFLIFTSFYLIDKVDFHKVEIKKNVPYYLWLFLSLTIILIYGYYVRSMNMVYIIITILISIIMKMNCLKKKDIKYIVLMILAFLGIILIFNLQGLIKYYIITYSEYNSELNDGALTNTLFQLPLFPLGIIARTLYGFIYPNPLYLINIFDAFNDPYKFFYILIAFGTIIQIYLLPYFIKSFSKINKETMVFGIIFFSIILTTFGFRHFIMLYPFYFLIVFRTIILCSREQRIKYFKIITVFIILAMLSYGIIKVLL